MLWEVSPIASHNTIIGVKSVYLNAHKSTELVRQSNSCILVNLEHNKYEVLNNGAFNILNDLNKYSDITRYLKNIETKFDIESKEKTRQFIDNIISNGFFTINSKKDHFTQNNSFISIIDNNIRIVRAEIAITNKCNLNCFYCYAKDDRKLSDLHVTEWKRILDKLIEDGLRIVIFSGGEPFLYEDFFLLLEQYHKKIIIEINSNGSYIDNECAKKLQKYNLKSIQISLDSSTKEYHDSMRGKGSWQKAINAISALRSNDIHVRINTVQTQKNEAFVDEMICLANKYDVEVTTDSIKYHGQTQNSLDIKNYKESYKLSKESESKVSKKLSKNEFIPICQCQIGYIAISSDGTLKPCNLTRLFYKNSDILTDSYSSDWHDKPFRATTLGNTINKLNKTYTLSGDIEQGNFPCKLQAVVEEIRRTI